MRITDTSDMGVAILWPGLRPSIGGRQFGPNQARARLGFKWNLQPTMTATIMTAGAMITDAWILLLLLLTFHYQATLGYSLGLPNVVVVVVDVPKACKDARIKQAKVINNKPLAWRLDSQREMAICVIVAPLYHFQFRPQTREQSNMNSELIT